MNDLSGALAAAAADRVVVTGRDPGRLSALLAGAGVAAVTAPGEVTRTAVAAGVALGGRTAIVLVHTTWVAPPGSLPVLVATAARPVAHAALTDGWPVLRPARPDDVAPVVAAAPRAVLLLTATAAFHDLAPPATTAPRTWRRGTAATLVAAGAATATMLAAARMLAGRGVPTSAVELPVLTRRQHAALLDDDALLVGPPAAAAALDDGRWPDALRRVETAGMAPRQVMDAVLAHVSVAG